MEKRQIIFIVKEYFYYDEINDIQQYKAFTTLEKAEEYIMESKSSYNGLAAKRWEWEEIELL